jgi:hypothetical protein
MRPPKSIHRPLGIPHTYPVDALSRLAGFYRGSNLLIGGKNHVAGLTLHATNWTAGSGPQRARLGFDVDTVLPPDSGRSSSWTAAPR